MESEEERSDSSSSLGSKTSSDGSGNEQDFIYPDDPTAYRIIEAAKGSCSTNITPRITVYRAECIPLDHKPVAIKTIEIASPTPNFKFKMPKHQYHPNILNPHRFFRVNDNFLWVVQPYMPSGSLRSTLSSSFPNGLSEPAIAIIMKQVLIALFHLHDSWKLHRGISTGNIFLDNSTSTVFLSDFRTSSLWFNSPPKNPSPEEAYTLAPELLHREIPYEYTEDTDIWSFGVTAMELAHGRPPLSHLVVEKEKKFSDCFKKMVCSCVEPNSRNRTTASALLAHPFFKECEDFYVEVEDAEPVLMEERRKGGGGNEKNERICGWKLDRELLVLDPCVRKVKFNDEVIVHYFDSGEETEESSGNGSMEEEEEERLEKLWEALGEIEMNLQENRSVFNSMVSSEEDERGGGGEQEVNVFEELEGSRRTNEELLDELERIRRGMSGSRNGNV